MRHEREAAGTRNFARRDGRGVSPGLARRASVDSRVFDARPCFRFHHGNAFQPIEIKDIGMIVPFLHLRCDCNRSQATERDHPPSLNPRMRDRGDARDRTHAACASGPATGNCVSGASAACAEKKTHSVLTPVVVGWAGKADCAPSAPLPPFFSVRPDHSSSSIQHLPCPSSTPPSP